MNGVSGSNRPTQTSRANKSEAAQGTEPAATKPASAQPSDAPEAARKPADDHVVDGARRRAQGIEDQIRDRVHAPGRKIFGSTRPIGRGIGPHHRD